MLFKSQISWFNRNSDSAGLQLAFCRGTSLWNVPIYVTECKNSSNAKNFIFKCQIGFTKDVIWCY